MPYKNEVTPQMIAQIGMKNYLKAISKRVNDHAIFDIIKEQASESTEFTDYRQYIQNVDLNEYKQGFEKAKDIYDLSIQEQCGKSVIKE
ncbi:MULTISPECIES: hypothetical protein [Clostridium]|uniref:hypothetical protein n=1 Tax=Clostridium TaxID=1485 RepID=UPI000824D65C|nr:MULTISPECIES: hypothetical protein [Clostridium]PJI08174.1 hypothetical protein CUB90_09995 [Clostridium sp. CT7]